MLDIVRSFLLFARYVLLADLLSPHAAHARSVTAMAGMSVPPLR